MMPSCGAVGQQDGDGAFHLRSTKWDRLVALHFSENQRQSDSIWLT